MKSAAASSGKGCRAVSRGPRHPAPTPHPAPGLAGSLLRLQRTAGNQAVAGLLATPRPELQAKLRLGQAGDAFEREADRVADAMVGITPPRAGLPAISQFHGGLGAGTVRRCARCGGDRGGSDSGETPAGAAPGTVQRKCRCGGGKDDETMQRREVPGAASRVPAGFAAQVAGLRGGGAPLSPALRGFFEPRLGHDFGAVRVHTGPLAERSAAAVRARAFTLGNDVVFGRGEYAPDSPAGRHLLAHELTHVVQQTPMVARRQPLEQRVPGQPQAMGSQPFPASALAGAREGAAAGAGAEPENMAPTEEPPTPGCTPSPGLLNSNCAAYLRNAWWLPLAYVNNATCACQETPNLPTAKCVRKVLQDRLAATPTWLKVLAASQKPLEANPATYAMYWLFVQASLTPRIVDDHVTAYKTCCCPSGPAGYLPWVGVTSIPLRCSFVGAKIRTSGSCHGTPGKW